MPYALCEFPEEGKKKMIKINLLPEKPEAAIWGKPEKVLWIIFR
jgi:hypothetical protein